MYYTRKALVKRVKIVYHYAKHDSSFSGDYSSIEVFVDGNKVEEYPDAYHENGYDKIEGFLDGLRFCGYTVKVTKKYLADKDY